jgi:hypothetical protein
MVNFNPLVYVKFKDGSEHKVPLDELPSFVEAYRDCFLKYKRERKPPIKIASV